MQYLNNIIEQDHRAIKKRGQAKFRAFGAVRRTIDGYEAVHRMRKRQVRWLPSHDVQRNSSSSTRNVAFLPCNTTL